MDTGQWEKKVLLIINNVQIKLHSSKVVSVKAHSVPFLAFTALHNVALGGLVLITRTIKPIVVVC